MNDVRAALVLGIGSCAGSHLADALLEQGCRVVGTHRPAASLANVAHLLGRLTLIEHEIGADNSLQRVLEEFEPSEVYVLASARRSDSPRAVATTNVAGTLALLEDIRSSRLRPRVVIASSSAVYGVTAVPRRLAEDEPLRPVSLYGMGKVMLEEAARFYARVHGLHVMIARPFNHPGPRESAGLMVADYAHRVLAAERGHGPTEIRVRSADTVRDFLDVRDAVAGYRLLARRGKPGEAYNFCCGLARTVGEVVHELAARSRTPLRLDLEHCVERVHQLGDPAKAHRELGWRPVVSWAQTLDDVMVHLRLAADR